MTEPAPIPANTPGRPVGAVLLDLDGTLVDSVYQHVFAWWEAFAAAGYAVSCIDIHRAIGRGSGDLVESLVGHEDDAVVDGHAQRWAQVRERTTAFHAVPELLRHCAEQNVSVVLCTSGEQADLDHFVPAIGGDGPIRAIVSGEDVERSKPAPQIVTKAVAAAGVPAERCVMVGDTVYDVQAATAAGVPAVGVLCGGISRAELTGAGAREVYGGPAELLAAFDQWAPR